jgi:hypothetical protein
MHDINYKVFCVTAISDKVHNIFVVWMLRIMNFKIFNLSRF